MSIVAAGIRQLIRNRVHDITDLAAEINERQQGRVTVEQTPRALLTEMDDYTTGAELPSASSGPQDCIHILERLEDIADQLRAIRQEDQPS